MSNTVIITRKYILIPEKCNQKIWKKKVRDFLASEILRMNELISQKGNKQAWKEKLKAKTEQYEAYLQEYDETDVFPVKAYTDYTYSLIRTAMEDEARRKNYIMTWIYSEMIANGVQYMDSLLDKYKFITETIKPAYRVKGSSKGSLFDDVEINNILGGYGNGWNQELTAKVKDLVKNGLLEGKVSLVNYKIDSPFTVPKSTMRLTHDYRTYEELCEHIHKKDCNLYLDYGSKGTPTIARFRFELGTAKNKKILKAELLRLYSGEYKLCGSKIGIERNKIVLYMTMEIPKQEIQLDEHVICGVALGMNIPAVCALNSSDERSMIGCADDFLRIRVKMQEQRRRLQRALKSTSGGHGRKKKLAGLERLKKREYNFVNTYCHFISKSVVDFAVKNKAKYIYLQDLEGYDTNKFVLRNWSYYKLQEDIAYKAERYGIIVKKVKTAPVKEVEDLDYGALIKVDYEIAIAVALTKAA